MNGGIASLVGWVFLQLVGPSPASGEWQERAMVEPSKTHLGDRPGSSSDHQAGVAGQSHEEVSCIAHPAGDQHGAGPIGEIDVGGGDDADDFTTGGEGTLSCNPRRRATTTADQRDAQSGDEFAGGRREVVSLRTRLGAAEDADLAATG